MGDISFIVPEATQNLVANPSLEASIAAYGATGGAVISRVSTAQKFGVYSLQVAPGAGLFAGAYYDNVNLTAGATYTFSVYGLWAAGVDYRIHFATDPGGAILGTPTEFAGNGRWERQTVTYIETASVGRRLYITKNGDPATRLFYIDGLQVEAKAYDTTYCDGDQGGCFWLGLVHASRSSRSAISRAGGRVYALSDKGAEAELPYIGFDVPDIDLILDNLPLQDGAILQRQKVLPRELQFMLGIRPPEPATFESRMTAMLKAKRDVWDMLKPDLIPDDSQPVLMRWKGPTSEVEIPVFYMSGLGGAYTEQTIEDNPVKFLAPDPYWRGVGDSGDVVESQAVINLPSLFRRLPGGWDNLDDFAETAEPVSNYISTRTATLGPDGCIYFGGNSLNYAGLPNGDKVARWNIATRTFEALGLGATPPTGIGTVQASCARANGDIYFGSPGSQITWQWDGAFSNGVAMWEFATQSWVNTNSDIDFSAEYCFALAIDNTDTYLYAGGRFSPGCLDQQNLATGVWNTMDTGIAIVGGVVLEPHVDSIAIHPVTGDVYVAGLFNRAGSAPFTVAGVAIWDGAAWVNDDLNGGLRATWENLPADIYPTVYSIAFDANGILWAFGGFDRCNGLNDACTGVAFWDGNVWTPVTGLPATSGPPASIYYRGTVSSDGIAWVIGAFTEVAGIPANGIAMYDGTTWLTPDIGINYVTAPGELTFVKLIDIFGEENVILGLFDTTGAATWTAEVPDTATVTNEGTASAYPVIKISRVGGATAQLYSIINETVGTALYFTYNMADGETVTINLDPAEKTIMSSAKGSILSELLPNSDLSDWRLLPGDNEISVFVIETGAPDVTVTLQWRNRYWTFGGAEQ